jgi:release factor glutamine methyltransferase
MKLSDAMREAASMIAEASCTIERPRLEAEILLRFHLSRDRVWIHTHIDDELPHPDEYFALVSRRARCEPIEYITSKAGFYGMDFHVETGVLIPRPETEILVDFASEMVRERGVKRIVEIGSGSGAISITLASLFTHIDIVAGDISERALEITRKNAERFGVSERVEIVRSSILDEIDGDFDMLVSNPPYIAEGTALESNVADFEPHEALFCDGDGTSLLKNIVDCAIERRIPLVVCEMGYDQRESMERFFRRREIGDYRFYKDLSGLDRGFVLDLRTGGMESRTPSKDIDAKKENPS